MDFQQGGSRGRGRGRGGGVPLLPSGVWESLHVTNEKMSTHSESLEKFLQDNGQIVNGQFNDILEDVKGSANNHIDNSPHSPHHEDDHRSGKNVIEKDLKGKDWNCPSCMNLNWSWRTNCNMCGTMKPNPSADERRDGAGGGFNERQHRASNTTVEVDEEGFDDFGRRIKKNAKADRQAKEEAALKRLQDKYKMLMPEKVIASDMNDAQSAEGVGGERLLPLQSTIDLNRNTTKHTEFERRHDRQGSNTNTERELYRRDKRDSRHNDRQNREIKKRRSRSRSRSRDRDRQYRR